MTQQNINLGTTANDGTGDSLRVAGGKINDNFSELYTEKAGLLSKLAVPYTQSAAEQIPRFWKLWKQRTKDLVIVVHGDSLTSRTTNNSEFSSPQHRPPLCQTRNWASAVWDHFRWGRELFYRFDANGLDDNPRFTESSGFVTVIPNGTNTTSNGINNTQWDDFNRREGITRLYSGTGTASITFAVVHGTNDKEAAVDFIYRTDLAGAETCTVTVSQGNGLLVAWNGTSYVEANGYTFSMRHPGVSDYKGNTKYNEVLKLRAVSDSFDSRNSAKTVTITKTDENDTRFMYWGIQTSTERYMVRIVSGGRGGLAFPTLLPFVDDDLFGHNADLIVQQIPLNGGINNPGLNDPPQTYVDQVDEWIFDKENAKSLVSNSGATDWLTTEVIVWTPHQTLPGFFDDSSFVSAKKTGSVWHGVADNRRWIANFMKEEKQSGVLFVDMFERWLQESKAVYGNIRDGFQTTNTTSLESFIRDGTHMNDLGVEVMAKHILAGIV